MRGILFLLAAATACGGSSAAHRAAVSGAVDGVGVTATNAAALIVKTSGTPSVDVVITNAADPCAANDGNLKLKQVLSLGVTSLSGAPLATGNYGVYDQQSGNYPNGNVAFVDWHTTNEGCADTTPPNTLGASGKVTVSHVAISGAGAGVTGEFDLLLQNGDRLKGSFDAPMCPERTATDAGCH